MKTFCSSIIENLLWSLDFITEQNNQSICNQNDSIKNSKWLKTDIVPVTTK